MARTDANCRGISSVEFQVRITTCGATRTMIRISTENTDREISNKVDELIQQEIADSCDRLLIISRITHHRDRFVRMIQVINER